MDASRFDCLTRRFIEGSSRRGFLHPVAGATFGLLGIMRPGAVDAGNKKKKKCKGGKKKCGKKCISKGKCCGGCGARNCCNGKCVNLKIDAANCGACNTFCDSGECANGACTCAISADCPGASCPCNGREQGGFACGSFGGLESCSTDQDCPLGSFCLQDITPICSLPCSG